MPSDGTRPDPGNRVVSNGAGRLFSTAHQVEPAVMAWSPTGAYLRSYAGSGGGPGEFVGPGALLLFVGPGDTLYAVDRLNRWSVFTPELEFIRVFTGIFSGRNQRGMHVTDAGAILSTGSVVAGEGGRGAHLMDLEGQPLAHFGDVPATSIGPGSTDRASA
jgi:hypothetical protein